MKQFLAFVKKEFYHILRDRRSMLILLGLPIVMIILFGFALSTELKDVRLYIYAPQNDHLTDRIADRFDASRYFTVEGSVTDPGSLETLLKNNDADMVMVFEEGFAHKLAHSGTASVQLLIDGSDPNAAAMMEGYAAGIIAECQNELIPPGTAVPFVIAPQVKMLYNPQMKSSFNFVPGVMGMILMLICAMMTSMSIVREKERGTMEVLLVSPVRPIYTIIAKAVPYLVLSALNLATILLLSIFLLQVPVSGSLGWLLVVSLAFIISALALGLLISSLVKTQVAAMLASGMVLMIPTMAFSGMIFPIENMPGILQWVSAALPARWYISAVRKIMIEGLPIYSALKELGILTGMAVLLLSVSLLKFKQRLE